MRYKPVLIRLGKYFVTIVIVWWIIHSYGWERIVETVLGAEYGWLVGGLILFIISVILGVWQWQIILKNKKVHIPFWKALKLYFVGMFFNNFVFGIVAGDAFKVASLHLDKRNGKSSFAATFLDRLAGLIAISFFAVIGGVIILNVNVQQNKQFFHVLAVLGLFIAIIAIFFFMIVSRRLQQLTRGILLKLPQFPMKELIMNVLEETFINRRGQEDKRMIIEVGILSFFIQSLRITVHIFCAQSLGIFTFATIHYFFVIVPITALLMIVPMPFGVRETIGGILFGLAGFSKHESVIMQFLATVVGVAGSCLGGVLFLVDKKSKAPDRNTLEA